MKNRTNQILLLFFLLLTILLVPGCEILWFAGYALMHDSTEEIEPLVTPYDDILEKETWHDLGLQGMTISALCASNNTLLAGCRFSQENPEQNTLYISDNHGFNWQPLASKLDVLTLEANFEAPSKVFLAGIDYTSSIPQPVLRISENDGFSWEDIPSPIINDEELPVFLMSHPIDFNGLFLGTATPLTGALYFSLNLGEEWEQIDRNGIQGDFFQIVVHKTNLGEIAVASKEYPYVLLSNDMGSSWTSSPPRDSGNMLFLQGLNRLDDVDILFAGYEDIGMYYSEDFGETWDPIGPDSTNFTGLTESHYYRYYVKTSPQSGILEHPGGINRIVWQRVGEKNVYQEKPVIFGYKNTILLGDFGICVYPFE